MLIINSPITAHLEEDTKKNKKHCKIKITKSYMHSYQDHVQEIISMLANLICVTNFMIEDEENLNKYYIDTIFGRKNRRFVFGKFVKTCRELDLWPAS